VQPPTGEVGVNQISSKPQALGGHLERKLERARAAGRRTLAVQSPNHVIGLSCLCLGLCLAP
jgi:hypothetical protein